MQGKSEGSDKELEEKIANLRRENLLKLANGELPDNKEYRRLLSCRRSRKARREYKGAGLID